MSRHDLVYITRKTHEIFNGLSKKHLSLLAAAPPGRTDTKTYVAVPIEDPDADVILKHEWSHVFFKTNLHALLKFESAFTEELTALYGLNADETAHWASIISSVCNALDDLRCNSLWEIPYPASAARIYARWRGIAERAPSTLLLVRLIGLGSGLVADDSSFDQAVLAVIPKVRRRGYGAVLRACRELIHLFLIGRSIDNNEPTVPAAPDEIQTLSSAKQVSARNKMAKIGHRIGDTRKMLEVLTMPPGDDPDPVETDRLVQTAMLSGKSTIEIEAILEQDCTEALAVSMALASAYPRVDQGLLEPGDPAIIVDIPNTWVSSTELSIEDSVISDSLRAVFSRVVGRSKRRPVEEGANLNTEKYIDFLLGSNDTRIFNDNTTTQGFQAIILLDMSGSMKGLWPLVSRACQILSKALKYPFVTLDVWGFSSTGDEVTCIYRFADVSNGVQPARDWLGVWGLTPIHEVLPIAMKHCAGVKGHRHIFLLSDGIPLTVDGSQAALLAQVGKVREQGAKQGIHMSALLIGKDLPSELADRTYGNGRWERIVDPQAAICEEMVRLVSRTFISFLRKI